jgi:predicted nuclease with TOPRIM domain|tara:strand:+ start:87 stop:341 length:255 start_codon:yes stop_codon:yes gene_type:complete
MNINNKDELLAMIEGLQEEVVELIAENKQLSAKKEALQDEVDSLWAMMDEITKSDIQNFSHILDEIKADVITRALMVSKKKVDC